MRITNDEYSPAGLLAEIATRRGVTSRDTTQFFSGERTSHDWLVGKWSDCLDAILESFKRYGTDVKPTQHIRDHGVDILLRSQDKNGLTHRIGFQIKSDKEAVGDSKKKRGEESMVATLKRQAFEAMERVDEWWIVCCFDMAVHHPLVQRITSEVAGGRHAKFIKVVEPREATAFLRMSEEEIDAFCSIFICKDDEVLREARSERAALSAIAASFVLDTIVAAIEGEITLSQDNFYEKIEAEVNLDNDEEKDSDIFEVAEELIQTGYITGETYSDTYTLAPNSFPAMCALYFEGRVRHQLASDQAGRFLRRMTE